MSHARDVKSIAISIVSHGHGVMVTQLIKQLLDFPEIGKVLLTKNIPELLELPNDDRVVLINNKSARGFSDNHNTAFKFCSNLYFCALNPDIVVCSNPFKDLIMEINKYDAALAVPLVINDEGGVEDSLRRFPKISSLLLKLFGGSGGRYHINLGHNIFYPDWAAGMFLLFRSCSFRSLSGFDSGFYLYYEDVDICTRVWLNGMKIIACPSAVVLHKARRQSRNDFKFMRWHISSMIRYFWKHWGRLPKVPRL